MISKILPKEITSYDLLKSLALVIMIIDHVGYYFYPEQVWWRVVGRMCVPMWFFLIGYANSRDLSPKIGVGAAILIVATIVFGRDIFPLNILVSIIIVRLLIDKIMGWCERGVVYFAIVAVFLFLFVLPTYFLTEYGTLAIVLAMFGYAVRREDKKMVLWTMFFALGAFVFWQLAMMNLEALQLFVMVTGLFIVFAGLYFFKPQSYGRLTKALPAPITFMIQFTGRRTLEIYVAHLLVFKALAFYLAL